MCINYLSYKMNKKQGFSKRNKLSMEICVGISGFEWGKEEINSYINTKTLKH